jgi:hypothetical protein
MAGDAKSRWSPSRCVSASAPKPAPPRFVTFEGGEGVGKSTQINALADMIRSHGHDVILTREPGGTEGAEVIRQLLLGGSAERWAPRAEALLFAAARSDHVERLIEPALASGKWVIADRFIDYSVEFGPRSISFDLGTQMVLKRASFGHAVNVTLGLPIVRTSVDHGTALDLAGTARADPGSLLAALRLAAIPVRPRQR